MTIWRAIPGYVGLYEVSNAGVVRRIYKDPELCDGKIIKPELRADGNRLEVCLSRNHRRRRFGVGPVVLMAFVGPRPEGMVCCHNDGNPLNNSVENLRWDTQSQNVLDQVRHGTHAGAAKTHCIRGHVLPTDKKPRRQCPTCKREYRHPAQVSVPTP